MKFMMSATGTKPSARYRIVLLVRELLSDEIETKGFARAPTLAFDIWQRLSSDQEFLAAAWEELGLAMVTDVVQQEITDRRRGVSNGQARSGSLADEPRRSPSVFEQWTESVGDKQIPILRMGKVELLRAAETRQRHATADIVVIRMNRYLASQLGEDEVVGDKFTTEQLSDLMAEIAENTTKELSTWAYSPQKPMVSTRSTTLKS
jgi:hypothetical protein